jgi:hypothetical protein
LRGRGGEGADESDARPLAECLKPARASGPNPWAGICEHLTAALLADPGDRRRALSEPQRVAFCELVTSSLTA